MPVLGVASTSASASMSGPGSPSSPRSPRQPYYDLDDDGYEDLDEFRDNDVPFFPPLDTDEDTEEASETDIPNTDEPLEMKEQMYQDKLSSLKKQLQQLRERTHPEYQRRVKRLEHQYHERLRINRIYREHMLECVEKEYIVEKKAAAKELEEKKIELRENLLSDFEDKRKIIESERHSMELNGDSMEVKPAMTRKLRRRPNEPLPAVEKRRKPAATALVYLLDEREIEADLRAIARAPAPAPHAASHHHAHSTHNHHNVSGGVSERDEEGGGAGAGAGLCEARVEDGKLVYERRWYHRGQSIYVEGPHLPRFPAHIAHIANTAIWVKKANMEKMRIYTSQLARGTLTIKRRAS